MSLKSLPILYINLGGEMIYILDQRLRAQNIKEETANKVIKEIIATMFESNLISEIFKPSLLNSIESLKTLFQKLAHSSVMKLNELSMTKLYELMIMAVKYEVLSCPRPKDIISMTLNHLDEMHLMVGTEDKAVVQLIENAFILMNKTYGKLSHGGFMRIRNCILTFFQDTNIRVSAYLNDKVQNTDGKLVVKIDGRLAFDIEVPGQIKYYHRSGEIKQVKKFDCGAGPYLENGFEGSFDRYGKRGVKFGRNIYTNSLSSITSNPDSRSSSMDLEVSNLQAKAQMDFLTNLIGKKQASKMKTEFKLNLLTSFNDDNDEISLHDDKPSSIEDSKPKLKSIVYVDARKKKDTEMSKIMGDLNINEMPDEEEDLLSLMDAS